MAVHAGTIVTVGANNVIDRLQSAGLGNVNLPVETIRECGNELVVDRVPGEADFSFAMESLDVSTDMMAFLTGKVGALASGSPPGSGDADGTKYRWEDCQFVNICSPWKDPATGSAGTVTAGHLIPGYYPTQAVYRFGVTDNATHTVDLGGGSFYYANFAPVEDFAVGDGSDTTFVSSNAAVGHRKGGPTSTDYRFVFGVIVAGKLMVEDVDYVVSGGDIVTPAAVTITFTDAPASGARIRFTYFTSAAKAYAQPTHAAATVKPGAVRGRDIKVYLGSGGTRQRVASVQTFEMTATVDSAIEREMGSSEIVGRTINGRDVTFTVTVRSRDDTAFLALLSKVTGYSTAEVFGYFNEGFTIPMEVQIVNPKNTAQVIKSIVIVDALFQPPGAPARVNTPTDFALTGGAQSGTFFETKGVWDGSLA